MNDSYVPPLIERFLVCELSEGSLRVLEVHEVSDVAMNVVLNSKGTFLITAQVKNEVNDGQEKR